MTKNTLPSPHPDAPLYPLDEARAAAVLAGSQDDPAYFLLSEGLHYIGRGRPHSQLVQHGTDVIRTMGFIPRASYMIGSLLAHKLARVAAVDPAPLPNLTQAGYRDLSHLIGQGVRDCLDQQGRFLLGILDVLPPSEQGADLPLLGELMPAHHLLKGFGAFLEAEPDIDAATTAWRSETFPAHKDALRTGAAMTIASLHLATLAPQEPAS